MKCIVRILATSTLLLPTALLAQIDNDPANDTEFFGDLLTLPAVDSMLIDSAALITDLDADWFKLQLSTGGVLESWCEPDSAFGLHLELFDYAVYVNTPSATMATVESQIPGPTPHAYVQLSAGDYRVKVNKPSGVPGHGQYRLMLILHTLYDQSEGNDVEATASLIAPDTCFDARIFGTHGGDDVDFPGTKCGTHPYQHQDFDVYKMNVDIPSDDTLYVHVALTNCPGAQNLVVQHLKAGGTWETHNSGVYGQNESFDLELDSGLHYLRVYEYYSWYTNCAWSDNYDLSPLPYHLCLTSLGTWSGIHQNIGAFIFSLYPNPASSSIILHGLAPAGDNARVLILNLVGQCLLDARTEGSSTLEVPIADWPTGPYIIEVLNARGIAVQRFVKE
ncbi:MAG: T9SS type A sorting domain-containing protein [Flavobacteriales bacterium]|nr:T9SS type A sorting domain-containing protein [Flavobacteriales bacterium]